MAKGHSGKKPMVKERTRKLSNAEKAKLEFGTHYRNALGHVIEIKA